MLEFYANKRNQDGLQNICKSCDKDKCKTYYENNKQKQIDEARVRSDNIKHWFVEFKKTKKCEKCGDERWYVLDFHHRGKKDRAVSLLVAKSCSIKRITEEINKCQILCSNCHRELHFMERSRNST